MIVGQDGILYFIDFSSTGTLSRTRRQSLRQNLDFAWERDPQNMARASLVLLEPLPPIDLIELVQELETHNWQLIYSMEASPDSVAWQERTSAAQWAGMMQLVRKYGITVDIQVLRLIRTTLLLESMAVRLHRETNFVDEYQSFKEYRAEQARRRVTDNILDQLDGKGNEQSIIRLDRIAHAVEGLLFRVSHSLALPSVNFNALMSKWSFAVYNFVMFLVQAALITLVFGLVMSLNSYLRTQHFGDIGRVLQMVATNPVYQIVVFIMLFVHGRTVLFRLDDKEV